MSESPPPDSRGAPDTHGAPDTPDTLGTRGARALASCFGLGFVSKAPGTVASLAALPPGIALALVSPWALAAGVLCLSLISLAACRTLGLAGALAHDDDPSWIVIDEAAGQWLALLAFALMPGVASALVAFVLFRAFDIAKPWPVSRFEALPGGFGILLDDLAAGVFACLGAVAAAGLVALAAAS